MLKLGHVRFVVGILALAGIVLLFAGLSLAAEQGGVKVQPGPYGGGVMWGGQATPFYYSLPGTWALQQEAARKEIELVPEQEAKLKELAKKYQEKMQQYQEKSQKLYAPLQNKDLSTEERNKLMKEMTARSQEFYKEYQEVAKWAGEQVKEVLLPHQIAALEKIDLRTRLASYLQTPMVIERLGLNDEQKEKLHKNRTELNDKVYQLQKDSFEEIAKILTPEQLEKLKQPFGVMQPGRSVGGGGAAPEKK